VRSVAYGEYGVSYQSNEKKLTPALAAWSMLLSTCDCESSYQPMSGSAPRWEPVKMALMLSFWPWDQPLK